MSFWTKLIALTKWCTGLSIFSTIAALLSLSLYIGPTLYAEYRSDSPNDPSSVVSALDRILHPDRWNISPLTTYNYKSHLRLSEDQNWMRKDLRHSWVYITGNQTCENKQDCERFDTAFDEVTAQYYLSPPAHNASIFTLNCDTSPFLCDGWAASPPALIRLESLGFPHCGITPDFRLQCPFGARYIPLPTPNGLTRMLGTYRPVDGLPDERWQLRSLFESTCAHEVYLIQRLLEYVGNGGEPMEFREILGDVIAGFGVADLYGMGFAWWLGEGKMGDGS